MFEVDEWMICKPEHSEIYIVIVRYIYIYVCMYTLYCIDVQDPQCVGFLPMNSRHNMFLPTLLQFTTSSLLAFGWMWLPPRQIEIMSHRSGGFCRLMYKASFQKICCEKSCAYKIRSCNGVVSRKKPSQIKLQSARRS